MPRTYIVQSWLDAAADYDQGDSYSGEQIGNRNQKSIGVHISRSGDQWKANIAAYADAPSKSKQKSKQELAQDLLYSLNPDEKKLDSLDEKEQALTIAYIDGDIEADQYEKAIEIILRKRYAIHKKMAKDSCEDMQEWIEENGSFEDKKKLYNSRGYAPPLATQERLLRSLQPKESKFIQIVKWIIAR